MKHGVLLILCRKKMPGVQWLTGGTDSGENQVDGILPSTKANGKARIRKNYTAGLRLMPQ